MSKPTERDISTATDLLFPGSIPDGDCDTRLHIETVAAAIAAAREEGRQEERKRCALLADAIEFGEYLAKAAYRYLAAVNSWEDYDEGDARRALESAIYEFHKRAARVRAKVSTETLTSINQWQRETFPTATLAGVKRHIEEEWEEFCGAVHLAYRLEEAADLIILLACYIDKASGGEGAQQHVDEKMQRNRLRRWNIQADGTGRHV